MLKLFGTFLIRDVLGEETDCNSESRFDLWGLIANKCNSLGNPSQCFDERWLGWMPFIVCKSSVIQEHCVSGTTISTAHVSDSSMPDSLEGVKSGNTLVAEIDQNRIFALSPEGGVHLIAGDTTAGFHDGVLKSARFKIPSKVVKAPNGSFYVTDTGNHVIRSISPEGRVATLAGSTTGEKGFSDDKGTQALFNMPIGLAIHKNDLYVADNHNHRIRKVNVLTGEVTTVAGNGSKGYKDGLVHEAMFKFPVGITVARDGILYVADAKNHRVRRISADGQSVSTVAGTGVRGFRDGDALSEARFNYPGDVLVDNRHNNIYVADSKNHRIRVISLSDERVVRTYAGSGTQGYVNRPWMLYKSPRGMYVYKQYNGCFQELVLDPEQGGTCNSVDDCVDSCPQDVSIECKDGKCDCNEAEQETNHNLDDGENGASATGSWSLIGMCLMLSMAF